MVPHILGHEVTAQGTVDLEEAEHVVPAVPNIPVLTLSEKNISQTFLQYVTGLEVQTEYGDTVLAVEGWVKVTGTVTVVMTLQMIQVTVIVIATGASPGVARSQNVTETALGAL